MTNKLVGTIIISFLLTLSGTSFSQQNLQTYYELNGKNRTPSYAETIEFSKKLAGASPLLHYTTFGLSHQGKEIPLLVLDKNGKFSPKEVKATGKKILLIQACIHPGEPVGKDAGLLLLRDIAIKGKHLDLLDNVTIIFIPILNVDGHERFGPYNRINQKGPEEMGWRTNALNLNLNRDYLKADTKEIRAFLKLWHTWKPDFFIDTHSTNGGDYQYTMTWAMDIYGGTDKNLVSWITENYLPEIEKSMYAEGYPIFPYVTYRSWHDPQSGLRSGVGSPMFSNTYASELNRPGLLLETHMLKPYHMRVESTYYMILHTLDILNKDTQLKAVIDKADNYTSSEKFRKEKFPLRFELTEEFEMVDFLGVEYAKKVSKLTGGNWFIYHSEKPQTYQVKWYNKSRITHSVDLPEAYVIPAEYEEIIDRLTYHGIQFTRMDREMELEVESYKFKNVRLSASSTEGRQTALFDVEPITEIRKFPKGSAIVKMNQTGARIVAHALEPRAPGSFAYWGFFNAVFQRVEYFESYVMETMAREMIAKDPTLIDKLNLAIAETPTMKENQQAILNWFYEQTPYYDQEHNVYPVGRVNDLKIFETATE